MKRTILILGLFFFTLIGIGITVVVTQSSQDTRSNAAEGLSYTIIKTNEESLISPYVRLSNNTPQQGDILPIDVFIKASGESLVEAQIVVTYDASQVIIDKQQIQNNNTFPVLNIINVEPGRAVFSLFVSDGYNTESFIEEKSVATLFFRVIGRNKESQITLEKNGLDSTSLYVKTNTESKEVANVLKTVNTLTLQTQ